ncbi:MAG: glycosyltransferase family 87 protein [Candidatus Sulfotelmatobacter sp.]
MSSSTPPAPAWIISCLQWLNPRRIRAQAIVLALCLWGVCAVDFATPGLFDRAGNVKFQDFLPFYISARFISEHRTNDLYDQKAQANELQSIVRQSSRIVIPNFYGPQVGLFFVPLAALSFSVASGIWSALSALVYFACIYAIWKRCPALALHAKIVALAAVAFPPLFHVFVRGQISALVLACFTVAFLTFQSGRGWLAGLALGFLVFKPQFLVAIPLILLLAGAWKPFVTLVLSAFGQLALTRIYFGASVMRSYLEMFLHPSRWIGAAELNLAPIQMHSLRSFWSLLIPSPNSAFVLYALTSVVVVAIATVTWRSQSSPALRFSALVLAAILVNPHLFVYDLLVLAPVLLIATDWALTNEAHRFAPQLKLLLYLAFVLPLFGPLSRWTHLQLSVLVFVAILWILRRTGTPGHKLASNESGVV